MYVLANELVNSLHENTLQNLQVHPIECSSCHVF